MTARNKFVSCLLVPVLLLASCAGRTPNPVAMYQPGDATLNCEALQIQMAYSQQQIATLLPKTDKSGSNALLGVAGLFLIVPWFFMDFSEADRVEVDAWRARYNYLISLFISNNCGKRMAMPSLEELQDDEGLRAKFAAQVEGDQQLLNKEQDAEFNSLERQMTGQSIEAQNKDAGSNSTTAAPAIKSINATEFLDGKDRLIDLYTSGAISKDDFERELAQLKAAFTRSKNPSGT